MRGDKTARDHKVNGPQHTTSERALSRTLSRAPSIPSQLAIGNRALGELLQSKIKIRNVSSARTTQAGGGSQASAAADQGVVQRKVKIAGLDDKKRTNFVSKINDGSALQYELDAGGLLQQKDKKKTATDEYSKQIVAAIADGQEVTLNLISKDDVRFIDSFPGGQVDYDDMKNLSADLFRLNFLHIIVERFSIADYEKNKATTSAAGFSAAHKKGLESEERVLKTMFPKKTIKYKGEALVPGSKKVDKAGNGSIDYEVDFTDVKYVFTQPIESNVTKENIIKSKIQVVK